MVGDEQEQKATRQKVASMVVKQWRKKSLVSLGKALVACDHGLILGHAAAIFYDGTECEIRIQNASFRLLYPSQSSHCTDAISIERLLSFHLSLSRETSRE